MRRLSATSPAAFRQCLCLDADTPFEPADFQQQDFAAADPGWQRCIGRDVPGGYSRMWLERTRGSSKTTDVATMVLWPLAFADKKITGICAAGDTDQAALLRGAVERILAANPWLEAILEVVKLEVRNKKTGSTLEIISSDAATSYGALVDFAVADEVSHWTDGRGQELWVSLLSTVAKKPHCLLVVISNAGWHDTWQAELRDKIRTDPLWYFHALDGPAPWITPASLAEQERLLPPKEYRRLWKNIWVTAAGAEWPDDYFPESMYFTDWPDTVLVNSQTAQALIVKGIALDPSLGRQDRPGDYAAIVYGGVDRQGVLWVDAELTKNRTATQQVERLAQLQREWNADGIGIEKVQFQQLLLNELRRYGAAMGLAMPAYGFPNSQPKVTRILSLTEDLSQHKLRIRNTEGGRLLVQQMKSFSMKPDPGVHDDGPDALEMLKRLIMWLLGERRGMRDAPAA